MSQYIVITVNDHDAPPEYCWGTFENEDACYKFAAEMGFEQNTWRPLKVLVTT